MLLDDSSFIRHHLLYSLRFYALVVITCVVLAMNAQALMKDLRILKQEEQTLVNLASKISDQLNRLKVEELALQNMVRLQNEELERKSRGSQRSINRSLLIEESAVDYDSDIEEINVTGRDMNMEASAAANNIEDIDMTNREIDPVNLMVNYRRMEDTVEEEEEDEEDMTQGISQEDIEQFVKGLS